MSARLSIVVASVALPVGASMGRDGCPLPASALSGPRYGWRKGQWTFSEPIVELPPGRYCYALSSIDAVGRESFVTTAWARVPARAS